MVQITEDHLAEIRKRKNGNGNIWIDEEMWTYSFAQLIEQSVRKKDHIEYLLGKESRGENKPDYTNIDIWIESQPISCKKGPKGSHETNSRIDLSFGNIKLRRGTENGIEYDYIPNTTKRFACFVEAKFLSDCAVKTSSDPFRNQLTRVIENLLCFQRAGKRPDEYYFTLLTPREFIKNGTSRFYGYKFYEYLKSSKTLIKDIKMSPILNRNNTKWEYPENIHEIVSKLRLNWCSYEEIIEQELDVGVLNLLDLTMEQKKLIELYWEKII